MLRWALAALWITCALPGLVAAQGGGTEGLVSPILTLDQERLFADRRLSGIVSPELEQRRRLLADENRQIEAELSAEELSLTERRAEMGAEEFSALADVFTEKVTAIRDQQAAKLADLQRFEDAAKQEFIGQVVAAIAAERGALVVIDRRSVILSAGAIDITEEAILRGVQLHEQSQAAPEPDEP